MTLRNVDMTNALTVPKLNSEQLVRIHVSSSEDSNLAEISFNSNNNGVHTEHGTLQVVFGDSSAWKSQISQILFLLETRIESLKLQASVGKAHRLLKPVIYKLFENLVKYSQNYQGLEEVFLDSDYRDAVGTVKLPFTAGSGHFLFNPFWMDAAVHLAGFLLNGNLKYPEDIACLSTGFETLRSFEELNGNTEYTAYVSMQDTGKHGILSGDAYVFDGKTLVMAMTGIKFQKMKKFVLNTIFQSGMPSAPQQTTTLQPSRSVKPSPQTMVAPKDQELDESTSSYGTITPDSRNSSPISPIGDEETGLRVVDALLSVTAAESGYNVDDMEPDTQFSDMGIDSLMMITILAGVRRGTGVEIPATFFLDHATVGEAKAALGVSIEHEVNEVSILETPKNASNFREEPIHVTKNPPLRPTKQELALVVTPPQAESQGLKSTHSSRTILLQGISSSAKPALFLLPDGNGSLTNYIQLPSLGSDLRVYGIESPFVKTPSDYTCSLGEVADKFIKVIKKQQPVGPYLLGGFSFSAIYAYEVARKLLQSDEQVNGLLLMDMAVPKYLGPDFVPTFEKIEAAGMIPKGRQTVRQKEHLLNTVRALGNSKLAPLSSDRQPKKTVLILSSSGLAAGKQQSSELARWVQGMTESPTRGWDALIGSVQVQKIDGEHFSLLKLPNVKLLIHFQFFIRSFLNKINY
jgi:iterative type I PKS product template protein